VVIHEYWGLNDWVKEQAAKLADRGYATLAIDLYREKLPLPRQKPMKSWAPSEDRAARDLHAAVEFLNRLSNVKKDRIGSIGWCMGGGYSLKWRCRSPPWRSP